MTSFAGGCLCGRVRYRGKVAPIFTGVCHCRNCQRFTGSAFETFLGMPKAEVEIEGELRTYQDTGDSGRTVDRRFCPNCGSGVATEVAVMPDLVMLLAGTLDDPSWVRPAAEIWCSSAQPWVALGGERKRFDRQPPPRGGAGG
jgi:hypothetical protein